MGALEDVAARLGMRVSQRWDATPEQQAAYAAKHAERRMMSEDTDIQIASRVRMLMRDDLDHEAVVCCARDRICALSVEKAALLEALNAALPKGVATDNRNIPDEQIIPLDFTMGELRRMAAAIAKASPSTPAEKGEA